MALTAVLDESVLFARDIRPDVNRLPQSAIACADDFERARGYLYQARTMDPGQLEVYVALYRFCCYRAGLRNSSVGRHKALPLPADYFRSREAG